MKITKVSVEYEYNNTTEMFRHISAMQRKGFVVYCGCDFEATEGFWVKFEKELNNETL